MTEENSIQLYGRLRNSVIISAADTLRILDKIRGYEALYSVSTPSLMASIITGNEVMTDAVVLLETNPQSPDLVQVLIDYNVVGLVSTVYEKHNPPSNMREFICNAIMSDFRNMLMSDIQFLTNFGKERKIRALTSIDAELRTAKISVNRSAVDDAGDVIDKDNEDEQRRRESKDEVIRDLTEMTQNIVEEEIEEKERKVRSSDYKLYVIQYGDKLVEDDIFSTTTPPRT